MIVQTEKKNLMWAQLGTSPSELWKLKPSETIAVNDPVIGNYTLIVSANLVAEANEELAVVEHRLPTKATATA